MEFKNPSHLLPSNSTGIQHVSSLIDEKPLCYINQTKYSTCLGMSQNSKHYTQPTQPSVSTPCPLFKTKVFVIKQKHKDN